MEDPALERNRRLAWARYYGAREDLHQSQLWAGELAEWLEALVEDLPDAAAELVELCQVQIAPQDRRAIRRYIGAAR